MSFEERIKQDWIEATAMDDAVARIGFDLVAMDQNLTLDFESLSAGNRGLFAGVAKEWWESVDPRRMIPIPWPRVVNLAEMPEKTRMSHVFAQAKVFESVGDARKAGWDKPAQCGEFWFKGRTIRVLVIWIENSPE